MQVKIYLALSLLLMNTFLVPRGYTDVFIDVEKTPVSIPLASQAQQHLRFLHFSKKAYICYIPKHVNPKPQQPLPPAFLLEEQRSRILIQYLPAVEKHAHTQLWFTIENESTSDLTIEITCHRFIRHDLQASQKHNKASATQILRQQLCRAELLAFDDITESQRDLHTMLDYMDLLSTTAKRSDLSKGEKNLIHNKIHSLDAYIVRLDNNEWGNKLKEKRVILFDNQLMCRSFADTSQA